MTDPWDDFDPFRREVLNHLLILGILTKEHEQDPEKALADLARALHQRGYDEGFDAGYADGFICGEAS